MKKTILIFITILISLYANSKENHKNLSIGLKYNQYGIIDFTYNKWEIGLMQSLLSESIKGQYLQLNLNYKSEIKNLLYFTPNAYYGRSYNGKYYMTGINLLSRLSLFNKLNLLVEIQPHYDSLLDYSTFYGFGANYKITEEVAMKISYDNIPEFRMSMKQFKWGVIFNSKNLYVVPEISFPINESQRKIKVLCSFKYNIKL